MEKRRNPNQASFFKTEIPKMPKGYYSTGPNPNLRGFVEEHATFYDPETDDYNVPSFDKPIKTTKATAIYNMHTYWSKKPHNAIREYIKHYTKPGDIVLDPMCGSGGTALAALMEGRAAIAIDLSPAATFITKNYCTPLDVDELQHAFEELKGKIKSEMDWLYETRCDRCDGKAITAYTVYSFVFQCPRCLEYIPLFDCVDAYGETKRGKQKIIKACPYCFSNEVVEEISTRQERFDPVPMLVSYFCREGCKPQRDQRLHNDSNPKKRKFFEKYDLGKIKEIDKLEIPYWYPTQRMMNAPEDEDRWGLLYRPGSANPKMVSDLFSKRSLWASSLILSEAIRIGESKLKDSLLFLFSSNIFQATKMQQYREAGGGFAKGTYYLPSIWIEREQTGCLNRKFNNIINGLGELNASIHDNKLMISTDDSKMLHITDSSIDYIFTDPPYSWKIQFGELNFIWETWLKLNTDWLEEEIIINEFRGKSDLDWAGMMRNVFGECYRVLKPGRWLSLCYHDTSEGTWQLVQDLLTELGFIPDSTKKTLYIDTDQKAWKQLVAEKISKRDLIINFRKPHPGELNRQLTLFGDEDPTTFVQKAQAIITEALENHPGSSADRLYDELVSRMVRKGEFERHNFDEILHSVAEEVSDPKVGSRWYLLEKADQVDESESRKETEVAAHLEAFMHQYLQENPGEIGVHYGDLFERYLPIGDKPRRLMQEWLPEFFFKTEDGTWRPPANEEERAQKEALRSSGMLRRIKRFANALLEGIPPYEHDIPANTASAANWIRQCRRAGLYEQGRALYEKGGFTFNSLGEEARMEVDEDYQICVRRSGKR